MQRNRNRSTIRDTRTGFAKWLDRRIDSAFPAWGVKRRIARFQAGMIAQYRATGGGRLQKSRSSLGGSADEQQSKEDIWKLREYARDQERNNTLAAGMLQTSVDNVIAGGHQPQARTDDDKWNDEAEAYFKDWSARADLRGVLTFGEIQRLAFRSVKRDGDIGFILRSQRLQAIEGDRIGTPTNMPQGRKAVNGVEMNPAGVPLWYWVGKTHPTTSYIRDATAIPAGDFVHLYRPNRFSATRGVTVFAPVIDAIDRVNTLLDSTVTAHVMAAMFGLVFETDAGFATARGDAETNPGTGDSQQVEEMEPGMIHYLAPGEKLSQVKPEHPSTNTADLIDMLCRFCGRHLGFPLELVLLNYSHSNFSNTRAALQEARRTFEGEQQWFQGMFLRRVWRYIIDYAVKAGDLPKNDQRWQHDWIAPGWQWIDPFKDIQADVLAVNNHLDTLANVTRKRSGKDWQEVLTQRARERKVIDQIGLAAAEATPAATQGTA